MTIRALFALLVLGWSSLVQAQPSPPVGIVIGTPVIGTCPSGNAIFNNAGVSGCQAFPASTSFANPSAVVGLAAVNGTATTAMRSDAAPALDQTAAYAFSGLGATNLLSASLLSWNSDVNINRSAAGTLQIGTTAANASGTLNLAALVVGSGGVVRWNNRTKIFSSADAEVQWQNNAQSLSTYFYFPTSGTFQLGQAPAAAPVPQTLQAQGSRPGTDSNVGGANLTVTPGDGTGTPVTSSALIFAAPLNNATASAAQTQTEVARVQGGAVPSWKWSANNSTGAGSAALGANSPAVTLTAPYTWVRITTSDGSTGYMPIWK